MIRFIERLPIRWIAALVSVPLLAQTSGCLGLDKNTLRETLSTITAQAISAGIGQWLSLTIKRALDVPTSFFGF